MLQFFWGFHCPLTSGQRAWSQTTGLETPPGWLFSGQRTQKQLFLESGLSWGGGQENSRSVDLNLSGLHLKDSEVLTSNFEVCLSLSTPRCAVSSSMYLSFPQKEAHTLVSVW